MKKSNILDPFLEKQGFLILDGALATELEGRGADLKDPLWSAKILLEAPELIQQVHEDYFIAGADVAITSTYQASFEGFAKKGISKKEATHLLQLSVELAINARENFWNNIANQKKRLRPLIAASIGPYGAYLADGSEYRGDYKESLKELIDFHRARIEVLANSGADLLAIETIPCLLEIEAILLALVDFPNINAWLSCSCKNETQLCSGESFAEAAAFIENATQIIAFGVNCSPPSIISSLLKIAKSKTNKPLVAYPNSGEVWNAQKHCWQENPEAPNLKNNLNNWKTAGAKIIGGCCRTNPETIRNIRKHLVVIKKLNPL